MPGCDPRAAGDQVLAGLRRVTAPEVRGAHDADLLIADDVAWIACEANDHRLGERADWPDVYATVVAVSLTDGRILHRTRVAAGGEDGLTTGACFVPRLARLPDGRIRCFFANEEPGRRPSRTWYRDLDPRDGRVLAPARPAILVTRDGEGAMDPLRLHAHGLAAGRTRGVSDFGLYLIDGIKRIGDRDLAVLNSFAAGQLALAEVDVATGRFTIVADIPDAGLRLDEAAVEQMPDGSWLLVARNEDGDGNYRFARSRDGCTWPVPETWPLVPDGIPSRPTLDRFGDVWCLGWNSAARVDGANRSTFHLDVSRDGHIWHRRFTFATRDSFQYPVLRSDGHTVWVAVTQGARSDDGHSGKEQIRFGTLCAVAALLG